MGIIGIEEKGIQYVLPPKRGFLAANEDCLEPPDCGGGSSSGYPAFDFSYEQVAMTCCDNPPATSTGSSDAGGSYFWGATFVGGQFWPFGMLPPIFGHPGLGFFLMCCGYAIATTQTFINRRKRPGLTNKEIMWSYITLAPAFLSLYLVYVRHSTNSQILQLLVVSLVVTFVVHIRMGYAEFRRNGPRRRHRFLVKHRR